MIQGIEFMNGSYLIVSDELWQWSQKSDGDYLFDCYKCYDQSKVGSAINANYALQNKLTQDDALATEDAESVAAKTYGNVVVVKEGNENSEKIKPAAVFFTEKT